ncbi:anthrone oxygenase family protein [Salana multivorans]
MSGPVLALTVAAVVTNGLLAGLYLAFVVGVIPGLRTVEDGGYVWSFRAINTAILNPAFLALFLGAPVLAVVGSLVRVTPWSVAAAVCSVVTFVITVAVNVPLNRGLDAAPVRLPGEMAAARSAFETRWNRWNGVRTVTGVVACTLLAIGAAG